MQDTSRVACLDISLSALNAAAFTSELSHSNLQFQSSDILWSFENDMM